jgi:hypothetical protein
MNDRDPTNPLPTEAEMFRVVVGVGLALLPVFVLSLVGGPGWAAILLGFEVGIAVGLWWRRRRAAERAGD